MPLPRLLRPSAGKRPVAHAPASVTAVLPRGTRLLGAVPASADGSCWLLATPAALVRAGTHPADGGPDLPERLPWDRVTRASWDAEERVLTLTLLGERSTRSVQVPAVLRYSVGRDADGVLEEVREVDEAPFTRALRERVEAAIVHHVSTTLPTGVRVTASVRRGEDGDLYTVLEPGADAPEVTGQEEALRDLVRRAQDGVGLPTQGDLPVISPIS